MRLTPINPDGLAAAARGAGAVDRAKGLVEMEQAPVLGRDGGPLGRSTGDDPASDSWKANEAAHRELAAELREKLAAARLGGGEKARARHTARGKLLPRDRVDALLDPGSPFLEVAPLAAEGMYGG